MPEVVVEKFHERYALDFGRLNYEWIAKSYGIEAHDNEVLDHPLESVIEPGGEIFFALDNGVAVGTVAMIPMGNGSYELAKMAVDPAVRGRGIGDLLMDACVMFARSLKAKSIILESNTKQEAAINLYRKFGFVEIPLDPNSHFVRANIRMELAIADANQ
jgi:ribosomal protein S18 acetylase RimI-like enzyme